MPNLWPINGFGYQLTRRSLAGQACLLWTPCAPGIFLNYCWDEEKLAKSWAAAEPRQSDVYVGIDVFGRGCPGGGGFNTCEAARMIANGMWMWHDSPQNDARRCVDRQLESGIFVKICYSFCLSRCIDSSKFPILQRICQRRFLLLAGCMRTWVGPMWTRTCECSGVCDFTRKNIQSTTTVEAHQQCFITAMSWGD
jgi:hypothetical protein